MEFLLYLTSTGQEIINKVQSMKYNVTQNSAICRNADIFETVGHRGFVKTVGVGGSLTGTPIDVGIIDDPFKENWASTGFTHI